MPSFKAYYCLAAAAAFACVANAETIKVTATGDNKFDPDSIKAADGTIIEFHFQAKNHSVVAGDYQYPCSPLQLGTGFYSGFLPTDKSEADKIFRVTVNGTDPVAFYSSQGNECAEGMVGIINPTATKNLTDYKERAAVLSKAVTPGKAVYGGDLVDNDGSAGDKDGKDGKDGKDDGKKGSDDKDNDGLALRAPIMGLLGAFGAALFLS